MHLSTLDKDSFLGRLEFLISFLLKTARQRLYLSISNHTQLRAENMQSPMCLFNVCMTKLHPSLEEAMQFATHLPQRHSFRKGEEFLTKGDIRTNREFKQQKSKRIK